MYPRRDHMDDDRTQTFVSIVVWFECSREFHNGTSVSVWPERAIRVWMKGWKFPAKGRRTYSDRRAVSGLTSEARLAGKYAATTATQISTPVATAIVDASVIFTPNNSPAIWADTSRAMTSAAGMP